MRTHVVRLLALVAAAIAPSAFGHGGGLNAEGCHANRKTGDYHCHRGGGSASSQANLGPPQREERTTKPTKPRYDSGGPNCFVGPRGGTYTVTKSGKKNYSGC